MKEDMYKTEQGQKRHKSPKMMKFLSLYNDPNSETFCNARGSALKAGYSESYASNLTHLSPDWMTTDARHKLMLQRAEANLTKLQNLQFEDVKHNPQLVKIWQDTSKYVSERLGKDEGWSNRTELTGKGGKQLFSTEHKQTAEQALDNLDL